MFCLVLLLPVVLNPHFIYSHVLFSPAAASRAQSPLHLLPCCV
jgi:hypothetical protein